MNKNGKDWVIDLINILVYASNTIKESMEKLKDYEINKQITVCEQMKQ